MDTFIRWAGSKRQLLGRLSEYWPGGECRYIEPFCGSASLFFSLEPRDAVLGDLNGDLIGALRQVQRAPQLVIECIKRIPKSKAAYYKLRDWDPQSLSLAERAARFLYLNHFCFNGIYRTNAGGAFNVPYSQSQDGKRFNYAAILAAARQLKVAALVEGDFEKTLDWARPGDFVYLDPPYAIKKRRVFAEYWENSFSTGDLPRLSAALEDVDRSGARFVLTYADSSEARRTFGRWNMRRIRAKRHIAGFADARRHAFEVLVTNIEPKGD